MSEHAHFKTKASHTLDCKTAKIASAESIMGNMAKLITSCVRGHAKAIQWRAVEEMVQTKYFSSAWVCLVVSLKLTSLLYMRFLI